MALVPVGPEHVQQISALHCEIMPGLPSILGTSVTRAVYEGYAKKVTLRAMPWSGSFTWKMTASRDSSSGQGSRGVGSRELRG